MRLTGETPLSWRRDWALYRSIEGTDSRGDPVRRYDMENPDFTGTAGTASGVCWQIKSGQWSVEEFGESATGGAAFDLYLSALEIAPFDRCVFGGRLWEVRGVQSWPGHRHITLTEVGSYSSDG